MKHKVFYLLALAATLLIMTNCCKDDEKPRKGKSDAVFNSYKEYGTVTDIDGNEYKTITIGTQTWMAENLRVTHYRNGDPISHVKDATAWSNQATGAYCYYRNTNKLDSIATYGYLYNGYCFLDSRGLAPEGWHVPSDAEWLTLVDFVAAGDAITDQWGVNAVAGGRMKETGTLHWDYPNRFADNSSGFTAISGGWRQTYQGVFLQKGYGAHYWTIAEYSPKFFYGWGIGTDFASIVRNGYFVTDGISVRCIKD